MKIKVNLHSIQFLAIVHDDKYQKRNHCQHIALLIMNLYQNKKKHTLKWHKTKKSETHTKKQQQPALTTTNQNARSWNAHRSMYICCMYDCIQFSQSVSQKANARATRKKQRKKITLVSSNELNTLLLKHAHKNKC